MAECLWFSTAAAGEATPIRYRRPTHVGIKDGLPGREVGTVFGVCLVNAKKPLSSRGLGLVWHVLRTLKIKEVEAFHSGCQLKLPYHQEDGASQLNSLGPFLLFQLKGLSSLSRLLSH